MRFFTWWCIIGFSLGNLKAQKSFSIPSSLEEGKNYAPGVVVGKLTPGLAPQTLTTPEVSSLLQAWGVSWNPFFPQADKPERPFNDFGEPLTDLTGILRFEWTPGPSVTEMITRLRQVSAWEYLQPLYYYEPIREERLLYVPSDPGITSQYHLSLIQAYEAWDVTQGDTNVVIAIVDGGTNFGHPDLQNYRYNYGDPIDGIDNDGNGYLDDCCGWSSGNNTNETQYNFNGGSNHGVFVTGVAAATTDNALGVAGVGFRCRYMPVKIVNPSGVWSGGVAGIFYAAQNGAHIINCSWGSIYPDPLLEDVTRYAVFNKNCLVVCAAGNSSPNSTTPYYPAAYEWCMAVAGTTASDLKWGTVSTGSSYYDEVDICAPAHNIHSTSLLGYNTSSGTSFATPQVSAAAALVKSQFPGLQARQIRALLMEKSQNIYSLPGNAPYVNKLGKGRLNVYQAVLGPSSPSPEMLTRVLVDGNDNLPHPGETVSLSGNFINWLSPSSPALTATLSTASPHVSIGDPTTVIGILGTLGVFNSGSDPFVFTVLPSCPQDHRALFVLQFSDGAYTHRQVFHITLNPSYVDFTVNNCHSTLASNGRIGFADEDLFHGRGLSKNGLRNALEAGSFVIGNSATRVSDATFGPAVSPFDQDFVSVLPALPVVPPMVSDRDAAGRFNDNGAGPTKLDVEVDYKAYAWSAAPNQNFIILDYAIKNNGSTLLQNVFAGLFANWRIANAQGFAWDNVAAWDASRRLGYVYSQYNPQGGYAGIKFLGYTPAGYYAFNNDGAGGSINVWDGFSTAEKWQALSNGVSRPLSNPGTVSSMISTGPFDIAPGAYARVSFALVVGDNLADLQAQADAAQARYEALFRQWTGTTNSDWQNPLNWDPAAVPGPSDDVLIGPAPHSPVTTAAAQCRDLVVKAGQILQVQTGAPLTTHRMLTNNGQIIVHNGPGLAQTPESILTGSGTWQVRRQIANAGLSHHFVGSAVQNLNLSDLAADIGGFGLNSYATFDGINVVMATCTPPYYLAPTSPYGNILQYNETETVTCLFDGWEVRTGGTGQSGRGYAILAANGIWLDVNGTAHNQDVAYAGITRTNTNLSGFQGFNLIANPYPSSLDWLAFRNANLGAIQGSAYLFNQGAWVTLDAFTPGQRIAPLQGFEVEAAPAPGTYTVTFRNNQRSASSAAFYDLAEPYDGRLTLRVRSEVADREALAAVFIAPSATWGWDPPYDGKKMPNEADWPELWLHNGHDSIPYSVMALPHLQPGDTLWLYARPPVNAGTLQIHIEGLGSAPVLPAQAILHEADGSVLCTFSAQNTHCTVSPTQGSGLRFLTFSPSSVSMSPPATSHHAWTDGHTVYFSQSAPWRTWVLMDPTGRILCRGNSSAQAVALPSELSSGMYLFMWRSVQQHGTIRVLKP
ncbi:MAG: S8 family serine peptidase [Flavobacteriales bacterium]|nr:S8 family serine peptidase [Flavobacteriales bacterium]